MFNLNSYNKTYLAKIVFDQNDIRVVPEYAIIIKLQKTDKNNGKLV